jgi:hypothetical protein
MVVITPVHCRRCARGHQRRGLLRGMPVHGPSVMPSGCSFCSTLCTPPVNPEAGLADQGPDLRRFERDGDVRSRARCGVAQAVAIATWVIETTVGTSALRTPGACRPIAVDSRWCRRGRPLGTTTTREAARQHSATDACGDVKPHERAGVGASVRRCPDT